MRVAMKESIDAFKMKATNFCQTCKDDLGLTAQFLGHVATGQAILCGTTSFRLDKLALYLSDKGPEATSKQVSILTINWMKDAWRMNSGRSLRRLSSTESQISNL